LFLAEHHTHHNIYPKTPQLDIVVVCGVSMFDEIGQAFLAFTNSFEKVACFNLVLVFQLRCSINQRPSS
jgi:hypothetical protein